jgi:hypothetical protein
LRYDDVLTLKARRRKWDFLRGEVAASRTLERREVWHLESTVNSKEEADKPSYPKSSVVEREYDRKASPRTQILCHVYIWDGEYK